jgi:hypothetical protein
MNEFWSYLMSDGVVYPLGDFDSDFDTAWPQVWEAAEKLAAQHKTELVYAVNETDLTEMSYHLQKCFNAKQKLRGEDYYMVGTLISKHDISLLRTLAAQHPECDFLEDLVFDCDNINRGENK